MSDRSTGEPKRGVLSGLPVLLGGLAGGALLTLLHVPAGGIVGAVAGSAAVSAVRTRPPLSRNVRLIGMVLIGCAAGVRLEAKTLHTLLYLAIPLLASVIAMLLIDGLLAVLLTKKYGVDPVTALLACAPGGLSEIAVVAEEIGARSGIVIAVHVVRVLVVVLVALPLLLAILGPT